MSPVKADRRLYLFFIFVLLILNAQCSRTARGSTLLHWAAAHGQVEIAERILALPQTDVDAPDSSQDTPLLVAVKSLQPKIAELLLLHGADPLKKDAAGMTALHRAAEKGSAEIAALLLEKSVDPEAFVRLKDNAGNEPIVYAFRGGFGLVVLELLQRQSPVTARNAQGQSLMHWAAREGQLEILRLLFSTALNVNEKDKNGYVPLHLAADRNQVAAVKLLLEHGADPNIPWPAAPLF